MKRMQQRQGQVEAGGVPDDTDALATPRSRPERSAKASLPARVAEFFREVRSELRQVAWPTRAEVANSATVVFITLVILVVMIFLLDQAFSRAISWLYTT
jgi:preprotein translocase subunit SecE